MIYDRTIEDVKEAKRIVSEKVQKFLELTEDEISTLERGCLSLDGINRIENQQIKLKSIFNEMGYYDIPTQNKEWESSEIFKQQDLERLVNNTILLKKAFFVFSSTPQNPKAKYYFEDLNRMEKILFDLEEMAKQIKDNYLICGTFECGEVI